MPFNCLTDNDKELINSYIGKFALSYSENPTTRRCEDMFHILRLWDHAKKDHLFKLLGNKLIAEKQISFTKSPNELQDDIYEAFVENDIFKRFANTYNEFINQNFVMYSNIWHNMNQFISAETLAQNSYRYCWKSFTFVLPGVDKPIKVNPGVKPMKILAKVAEAGGFTELFEKFRIAHSMILNQKCLDGTLCLSIHPLDYMTMSDNDMDWDSCMNWREPGEYRQGTVEMMNSDVVLVAYLKSSRPFVFSPLYSWNNKRWRTLVVVNDTFTVNVKGYPYHSDDLNDEVQKWIVELAKENLGIDYEYEYVYDGESLFDKEAIERLTKFYFETGRMYNDFGRLKDNMGHVLLSADDDPTQWPVQFYYSGPSECMWCGCEDECVDEGSVLCEDCANVVKCDYCESKTDPSYLHEIANGDMVCSDCLENNCSKDPVTEEYHYNNIMEEIFLSPYERGFIPYHIWQKPSVRFLRSHPREIYDKFFKNGFNSVHCAAVKYSWGNDSYSYVSVHDLTEEGKEIFGLSDNDIEDYKLNGTVEEVYNHYTIESYYLQHEKRDRRLQYADIIE